MIDLFSSKGGVGINQSDCVFLPNEEVVLYAFVSYNGDPVQNILVAFYVNGPSNLYYNITLFRVMNTNATGIAQVNFRIPVTEHIEQTFGKWDSFATAEVAAGQTLVDALEFFVTILGDIDGNGVVEIKDLVLLAQAYGSKPGDPNWNSSADLNNSQVVDLLDLVTLAQHYGKHYP